MHAVARRASSSRVHTRQSWQTQFALPVFIVIWGEITIMDMYHVFRVVAMRIGLVADADSTVQLSSGSASRGRAGGPRASVP